MNQISKLIRKALIPIAGIALSLMLFSSQASANCGMIAHFTYTVSGYTVKFTDSSYTTGTSFNCYSWNFGDSGKSSVANPSHTFKHAGKFAVTHYVYDSGSTVCVGYVTDTIVITAPTKKCSAAFSYVVAGKKVTFTNNSTTSGGFYCSWKFGDGHTDNSKNPSHTYGSTATSEKVTLYVSNGAGCYDSITQTIALGVCGMHCNFKYSISGYNVTFTDSSYTTGTPFTTYSWSFGDSGSSSSASTSHTYKHSGKFVIIHYAYDSISKCYDHKFDTIYISSKACKADFSYTVKGSTVNFTNNSSTTGGFYCKWKFGDGHTDTTKNPSHLYGSTVTSINVTLYVSNGSGCYDSITKSVVISSNCGIHSYFTYSISGKAVTFTDSSWTTGSKIAVYYWNFGDTASASTKSASHTYKHDGKFVVTHYAIDSLHKCYVTYVDTIVIGTVITTKCGMHAYFIDSISGKTIYFKNSSYSTGNAITNYYWSYGDGTTSTGKDHSHTYAANGKYKVLLYVWDSISKCAASYTDSITISTVTTKCGMHAYFHDSISGKTVYFANSSYSTGNPITNYYWSYGDGTTSTGKDHSHTYAANGKYKVLLYVWDSISKCAASYTDSITIGGTTSTKTYDLLGYVYMKSVGLADYATVYLINYKFSDSTLNLLDSFNMTPADSGKYHFGGLKPGSYLVKAALTSSSSHYKKYLPTYNHSSMHWDSATYVTIVSSTGYAGIFLVPGSNPGGAGFIGGKVTAGANKVGDPIANIEVQLYDASNNLIAFTYSDANGAYGFSNLAYGSYTVYPEVLGKQTTTATVSVDGSTPSLGNVGITVDSKAVTASVTGIETSSEQFFSAVLYPNPASEALNIEFNSLVNAKTTLAVFDVTGRMVLSQNIALNTGKQQVRINTDKFPTGFYLIKISDNNGRFESQYRFIKAN